MLKIKLDKEYNLKLGPLAVEKIEDEYKTTIQKFLENTDLTSKILSFVLFVSTSKCSLDLDKFKEYINENYEYEELMIIFSALISGKKSVEEMEEIVDSEKAKIIAEH